ncbi:MAG: right-handed parallel beta-helix repeat-containing protein [Gammaproteobacteria bacterium]|nr:right-handed parallel beta-helix repeat-containing protein [Gammaproteobacteria bacterium]
MNHAMQLRRTNFVHKSQLAQGCVLSVWNWIKFFAPVAVLFAGLGIAQAATITVNNEAELRTAVDVANSSGGNTIILVSDGVYTLTDTLYINAPNVTLSGKSGNRANAIIQGDAMSANANVGNLLRVTGSGFKLNGLTLRRSGLHLIQIVGEANADSPEITDCVMQDAYEQMMKVSIDPGNLTISADYGLVENCLFEYTAGIGPQYYIGGIDAHGAKHWVIRNNTFLNIISPNTDFAEHAVHIWNGSADNLVEKNLIVNCDRGIGFGLGDRGNSGGVIRNNMIYHAANRGDFADVGIALENSPETSVYNNSIFMEHNYRSAIEYRFPGTTNVTITNNLTNKEITLRDGASGTISNNLTTASRDWFVNVSDGDLHLASSVSAVVDMGLVISDLTDDFDSQSRPQGAGFDIGADEYSSNLAPPKPPTNLHIVTD